MPCEDGCDMFLQNIGNHPQDYMTSQLRRNNPLSSFSSWNPWNVSAQTSQNQGKASVLSLCIPSTCSKLWFCCFSFHTPNIKFHEPHSRITDFTLVVFHNIFCKTMPNFPNFLYCLVHPVPLSQKFYLFLLWKFRKTVPQLPSCRCKYMRKLNFKMIVFIQQSDFLCRQYVRGLKTHQPLHINAVPDVTGWAKPRLIYITVAKPCVLQTAPASGLTNSKVTKNHNHPMLPLETLTLHTLWGDMMNGSTTNTLSVWPMFPNPITRMGTHS
jgi:hypothetical protein